MLRQRIRLWLGFVLLLLCIAGWLAGSPSTSSQTSTVTKVATPESAPLCPWREPADDLRAFFPDATRYHSETRILSGQRIQLAQRLGRTPTAAENSLQVHRVYQTEQPLGSVLARRVKGEFGAIEIVLAVAEDGRVRGVRLQRMREPEAIARVLQSAGWLATFNGRTAAGPWIVDQDLGNLAPEARPSARAVAEGVRSLLILLDTARTTGPNAVPVKH